MKSIIFIILLFVVTICFSCNSNSEQKQTEKQLIDEMNKSMEESSNDMSIDTSATDSTILKN